MNLKKVKLLGKTGIQNIFENYIKIGKDSIFKDNKTEKGNDKNIQKIAGTFFKICFLQICLFVLSGCQNAIYLNLQRPALDPESDKPKVDNFSTLGTINLSWQKDQRCDYFILYRSDNQPDLENLFFEKIYEGKKTKFADSNITTGNLYRYRLDKVRGKKIFKGSEYGLGVAVPMPLEISLDKTDFYNAKTLEYKCNSCCYYYRFDLQTELKNDDWFKVKVPAMKKAEVKIDEVESDFFRYIKPGSAGAVKLNNKASIYLENNTYEEKYMYFVIQANPEKFVKGKTGGTVKSYKLELIKICAQ
ncbi:MAG: hypothetical protein ACTTHG_04615 [Treponemataceae bacterium]